MISAANDPPRFGGFTVQQLVDHVGAAARYEALGIEALEILAARSESPVVAAVHAEVTRSAEALVAIRSLLLAFVGHEATLEAAIAAIRHPAGRAA